MHQTIEVMLKSYFLKNDKFLINNQIVKQLMNYFKSNVIKYLSGLTVLLKLKFMVFKI